jgi:hypothetical protein
VAETCSRTKTKLRAVVGNKTSVLLIAVYLFLEMDNYESTASKHFLEMLISEKIKFYIKMEILKN